MKIVIYNDSKVFGGHEQMVLSFGNYVAHNPQLGIELHWFYSPKNRRLAIELESFASLAPKMRFYHINSISGFPIVSQCQGLFYLAGLIRSFSILRPDIILSVQGLINISWLALVAARYIGIPAWCYLPMAYKKNEYNIRFAFLRDITDHYLYHLPNSYITISQFQKELLVERGVDASRINVVPNGIPIIPKNRVAKIRSNQYIVALVGRVDIKQKGHMLLINAVDRFRDRFIAENIVFRIIGDGPHLNLIKEKVAALSLSDLIQFHPWNQDKGLLYAGIDMLIMPSRFEGVPLVMLEGLQLGLPVVASNIPAFKEFLPSQWLFSSGDPTDLLEKVLAVKIESSDRIREIMRETVLDQYSVESFCKAFVSIIQSLVYVKEKKETVVLNHLS